MSKENKTLDKHENGNDFIADVSTRLSLDNFIINPWRFEDYNVGIYQRYTINPSLQSFDTPVWNYYNNNPDCPPEDLDDFDFAALQMGDVKAKTFNRITRLFDDYITENVYAADLIALNDYYNIVGYDLEKDYDRASRQFFKDIRRSISY